MKVLMVCLGNICRSPLAEGVLARKIAEAGLDWKVDSAGTNGLHIGEAPHRLSQKVARQHGLDISLQRSRAFQPEDFRKFDRVYAMAADVVAGMHLIAGKHFDSAKTDLLLNLLYPGQHRDLPDPWYSQEAAYHEVYELIDQACDRLISPYRQMRKPTTGYPNQTHL